MTDLEDSAPNQPVGPVLHTGSFVTDAIIQAIRELNPSVEVTDRGAYVRVMASNECHLTAKAVESITGQSFHLPSDLEAVMSSFKGKISINEREVVWTAYKGRAS